MQSSSCKLNLSLHGADTYSSISMINIIWSILRHKPTRLYILLRMLILNKILVDLSCTLSFEHLTILCALLDLLHYLHHDHLLYQYKWRRFFCLFKIHDEWTGVLDTNLHFRRSFTYWSDQHSLKNTNWQLVSYRLNTCITIADLHHTKTLPSSQNVTTNWVGCVCQSSEKSFLIVLQALRLTFVQKLQVLHQQEVEVSYLSAHCHPQIKTLLILLGKFIVELSWTKYKSSLDYFSSQNGDDLLRVSSKNCSHSLHHISSYRNRTHFTLTCVSRNGFTSTLMQSNRLDLSTLIVTYHKRTVWNKYIRRYKRSLTH